MADFKVVTSDLRKEAKLWQEKVDKAHGRSKIVLGQAGDVTASAATTW